MLSTRATWIVAASLVFSGYLLGLASYRYGWPPINVLRRLHAPPPFSYVADVSRKTSVPCPARGTSMAVILALGQSNASNAGIGGEPHVRGEPAVVNFFDGTCYVAEDPLLGSDGNGNSVWTLVANHLVAEGRFARVVIAPFTISATSINDWAGKEYFQRRLDRIVTDLNTSRLPPTIVVWFQGEADNQAHTAADVYTKRFESFYRSIRARGVSAPMYVSVTTLCQNAPDPALRAAQQQLQSLDGIRPGPDTDTLGYAFRWDGCHFTTEGRTAAARMWTDALLRR